jgi:peptidoglycan hydrolase-like protein with peptidoglycan-binding domain
MNRFIMEELQRMQLLSNYDNSKTLSEQQISKRERQLYNYYTKNYSNVKQIQTKLQELGLDIGASNPDGILGKSTLESILFALDLVNAPKDYKRKDGKQTDDERHAVGSQHIEVRDVEAHAPQERGQRGSMQYKDQHLQQNNAYQSPRACRKDRSAFADFFDDQFDRTRLPIDAGTSHQTAQGGQPRQHRRCGPGDGDDDASRRQ